MRVRDQNGDGSADAVRADVVRALKEQVAEVEATASRLRSVLDNVLDGIITIDDQGTIFSFNRPAEDLFGYKAEEVVGRNVSVLMPEPYKSEHDGYVRNYLRTGVAKIIGIGREVTGRRKDGSTFPMDLAVSRFEADGKVQFTGICRNITERKRLEDQVIQSSKLASLGELVGGISHEINNPTGIILMRAASLMEEAAGLHLSEDVIDDIRVIERQARKVAQITTGLLAFSRQAPFRAVPGSLNATVESALGLVEHTLGTRGIVVRRGLDPALPEIEFDATRIEQVLLNLFNNAMDAMPEGGELKVVTERVSEGGPGWARVGVHDTGVGIPREHMDRLFDPFFTTKDVGKGTGLGLSISYGIVQEHRGRMEVESTWGKGASFYVYLPV